MEIMSTTAVYHNKETDLSGGNVSFWKDDEEDKYDRAKLFKSITIASLVIYCLASVLGVLGNGVVIWATGLKMKKTVDTVCYLNLAVADFLATAFLPMKVTERALDRRWPFGTFMCKMEAMVFYTNMYVSIYILVIISVDRCVRVACPVWAQNHRSVRKMSWVSLGVWVLGLALSFPYVIFRDTRSSDHDKDIIWCYSNFALCDVDSRSTPAVSQLYKFRLGVMIITRFLVGFMVPFAVIVSCYSVIIYRLRNNSSLAGRSGRSFKIMATVIAVFFLCWAPYHITFLIHFVNLLGTGESSEKLDLVVSIGFPITNSLALLNSCLNPLLYVFMGQGFKGVFRRPLLKVMEKAFTEELPQTNTSTDPAFTRRHGFHNATPDFPVPAVPPY